MTEEVSLRSGLLAAYFDLLQGRDLSKYPKIEALSVREMFEKRVTLAELRAFQERRAAKIEWVSRHSPIECRCGLMCFDLTELSVHLTTLSDRCGHGMRPKGDTQ